MALSAAIIDLLLADILPIFESTAPTRYAHVWQDKETGVNQTVVEMTVELKGIWQMARPETVKMGKNGPEYKPMEKNPSSQLGTFTLPGAAQKPSEAIEIKILDMMTGDRSC